MKPICTVVALSLLLLFPAACGVNGQQAAPAASATERAALPSGTNDGLRIPDNIAAVRAFPEVEFDQPLFITGVPGKSNRLAVVEQAGRIKLIDNSDSATSAQLFLDITDRVHSGGEEGLLGLSFDPGFESNGRFYVYYSAPSPRRTVLSRFTADTQRDRQVDRDSEEILLEAEQPYANHNGGMIAFGPDGYLYLGLGDGGGGGDPMNNAQDKSTLLGSILRIDPRAQDLAPGGSYGIPAGNPFAGADDARGEIWAYGFRNPYRFSFDRDNGDLWAGDVGQSSREEIDLVVRGGDYGWNIYEGTEEYKNPDGLPPADFQGPVIDYGRFDGLSVIGGYVYRGQAYPDLNGIYFYGDYGSGNIWALVAKEGILENDERVAEVPSISSFGEDSDGELYIVSLEGGIYRLVER